MKTSNKKSPKIGLIARSDNSGLGVFTQEFYKNLPIEKVLVVLHGEYQNYPEKFDENKRIVCQRGTPGLEEIEEFLDGIDVVLTFETPYNWNIFTRAREKGVKTALFVDYEWLSETLPANPDLYLCGSEVNYYGIPEIPEEKKALIPCPINDSFQFQKRKKAETFVFNNGHGGFRDRNSWKELFEAISLVKEPVNFLIRSQKYFPYIPNDSRIEIQYGDIPHDDLYKEGDVLIHPHKFGALSMPVQEGIASGMPVITTDLPPYHKLVPESWLIKPEARTQIFIRRQIEAVIHSPTNIAKKISEFANKDISQDSEKTKEIAQRWRWKNVRGEYLKALTDLCQT